MIAIDLGTTNIKVAAYNNSLQLLFMESENVAYLRNGDRVEFDAEQYFETVSSAIKRCCAKSYGAADTTHQIVLTGQAESLIMIDTEGKPLRNGISWLDMRSKEECEELMAVFDEETCFQITGQPAIIPTWPITKMLWIRKHEPHIFSQVAKYVMLKDYIQFRLTGKLYGEYSIYNFTYYFDIRKKQYWEDMLAYCGVSVEQLPQLVEPCTNIGAITRSVADDLGLHPETTVNVGTLDHFAGMIGTGNIREGIISESTGTVLSIATMVHSPIIGRLRIPCHYGPFKDTYVLLPVCEAEELAWNGLRKTFWGIIRTVKSMWSCRRKPYRTSLFFFHILRESMRRIIMQMQTVYFMGLK
ncbi:L-fuculokinase [Paenibacillus sp. N3.4]|uniref:FGGY-family carbohydrate kinase n=1 Tax=Paenibacillus sp. N3.4 TaxID=2603222 RepID=UPI001C9D034D|nr:FGGY family carbohydrate kinase [Paenibacillus sp. N3.4]